MIDIKSVCSFPLVTPLGCSLDCTLHANCQSFVKGLQAGVQAWRPAPFPVIVHEEPSAKAIKLRDDIVTYLFGAGAEDCTADEERLHVAELIEAALRDAKQRIALCGGCGQTYQSPSQEDAHGTGKCVDLDGELYKTP